MYRMALVSIVSGIVVGLAAPAAFPASTSPGKNAVFVSATNIAINSTVTLVAGMIAKGKKKHVLAVEGTVYKANNDTFALVAKVNGVVMEPGQVFGGCPAAQCLVTGTWWLDLDAAEVANPGVFIGEPLNVELVGEPYLFIATTANKVSMTVRQEKK